LPYATHAVFCLQFALPRVAPAVLRSLILIDYLPYRSPARLVLLLRSHFVCSLRLFALLLVTFWCVCSATLHTLPLRCRCYRLHLPVYYALITVAWRCVAFCARLIDFDSRCSLPHGCVRFCYRALLRVALPLPFFVTFCCLLLPSSVNQFSRVQFTFGIRFHTVPATLLAQHPRHETRVACAH